MVIDERCVEAIKKSRSSSMKLFFNACRIPTCQPGVRFITVTQVGVEATAVGIFRMKKSSCRLKLVCPGAWRGVCPSDYPRSGN
jgi:hypothetical protein